MDGLPDIITSDDASDRYRFNQGNDFLGRAIFSGGSGGHTFDFLTEVYIGPIHIGRAAANNIGYMCYAVYHALPKVADGHPDPETGKCTSMSTVMSRANTSTGLVYRRISSVPVRSINVGSEAI